MGPPFDVQEGFNTQSVKVLLMGDRHRLPLSEETLRKSPPGAYLHHTRHPGPTLDASFSFSKCALHTDWHASVRWRSSGAE